MYDIGLKEDVITSSMIFVEYCTPCFLVLQVLAKASIENRHEFDSFFNVILPLLLACLILVRS